MIGKQLTKRTLLQSGAVIVGGGLIACGAFLFVETRGLGFPDGHISDVDRVLIPYHYALAVWAVSLGLMAFISIIRDMSGKPTKIWWAALLLGVAAFAAKSPYKAYLATFLASSSGG